MSTIDTLSQFGKSTERTASISATAYAETKAHPMPKKFVDTYDYEAAIAQNAARPIPAVLCEWVPSDRGYKYPGTLRFWCPHCDHYHSHGAELQRTESGTLLVPRYAGHRSSHCRTVIDSPFYGRDYYLLVVGEIGTLPKPDRLHRAKPYQVPGVHGYLSGYLRKQRRALAEAESRS